MLKIIDGPGFKNLLFKSGVLTQEELATKFTFAGESREGHVLFITHIGGDPSYSHYAGEEFSFVAYRIGTLSTKMDERYYFIGTYNARSKKGVCMMMNTREFFETSTIAHMLFPIAGKEFSQQRIRS
jgi:hypothetical protein